MPQNLRRTGGDHHEDVCSDSSCITATRCRRERRGPERTAGTAGCAATSAGGLFGASKPAPTKLSALTTVPAAATIHPTPAPAAVRTAAMGAFRLELPDSSGGFHYHPFRFHIDGGGTITQRTSEKLSRQRLERGARVHLVSHFPSTAGDPGRRLI